MENKIYELIYSGMALSGTIYAILYLLKMTLNDVMFTHTVAYFDTHGVDQLKQQFHARVGILLLIASFCNQCINTFFNISSVLQLLIIVSANIIICTISIIIFTMNSHKKQREFLDKLNPTSEEKQAVLGNL